MEEVLIYNPDIEDFSVSYALHTEAPKRYTINGLSAKKFPSVIAEHMTKHLADKIYNKRNLKNYPQEIIKIRREITELPKKE